MADEYTFSRTKTFKIMLYSVITTTVLYCVVMLMLSLPCLIVTSLIGIQRSRDNDVYANLLVGGGSAVEFNEDCRKEDLVNKIRDNAACGFTDEDSWSDDYGRIYKDKSEVIEDFRSRFEGIGSAFVPDADQIAVYEQRKRGE